MVDIDNDKLLQLWDSGMSIADIAVSFGRDPSVIRNRLRKLNIRCDRSSIMARKYKKLLDDRWADVKALLDSGASVHQVTLKLHIAHETVNRLIAEHNYDYCFVASSVAQDKEYGQKLKELSETHTVSEMSEILGISVWSVYRHLAAFGLTRPTARFDILDQDVLDDWNKGMSINQIAHKYKCTHDTITKRLAKYDIASDRKSGIERHFDLVHESDCDDIKDSNIFRVLHDLTELGITYEENNRTILKTDTGSFMEIDIYLPDYKLGIEINPTWTHSVDSINSDKIDKFYHQTKSLLAEQHGMGLIHLYDSDFVDERRYQVFLRQLKALVSTKIKLGARQCIVKPVDRMMSNDFLNMYHFQGGEHNSKLLYGLFYDDKLIGVLTAGKSRYTKHAYEIIRYCIDPHYIVIGCFDKLFAAFLRSVNPCTVVSYMDLNKRLQACNVYEKHGFVLEKITMPDYVWINPSGTDVKSRYSVTKSELVRQGYDDALSEVEIMLSRHYYRVFGSGSKRYVWYNRSEQ